MKKVKQLLFILFAFSIISFVVGCSSSNSSGTNSGGNAPSEPNASNEGNGEKGQITIKFAHSSAPESARDLGAQKFKEIIEAETNGQVTVEIYPSSQLGNPTEILQAVQMGNVEMSITPTSFMGGFQPFITLLDIPFLFPNDLDKLLEIQEGEAMRNLLDKTDDIGIRTLGIWHTGYKQFTGPKALTSPEDFNGLKFRAMPSPIIFEQFKVLGASPTDIPFAETYNALQTGTINGQENPLDTTYDMKLHEVQKVTTMTDHGVLDQMILVNKAFYDGLDESIKDAMQKAFIEGRDVTIEKTYENIEEVYQIMKDNGMEFVEISAEQRQVFIDKVKSIKDLFIETFGDEGKELLEGIEKSL